MASWPQFWNRLTIAAKLNLSFGVLFLLLVMIVLTWFFSLELERRSKTEINLCREIENIVLDMDRKMEKASRLHRDFFLYHARIGLAEAHVQYAQPSVRLISQAVAISSALKVKIQASGVSHTLGQRKVDLNLYLSSAKRFADTSIQSVELITRLAAPEHGLEARFESTAAALFAEAAGSQKTKDRLQEVMTFYLQYKVSRQRHVMQSAFNVISILRQDVGMAGAGEPADSQGAGEMLASLKELGDEILVTDYAIQQLFNDFSLQVQNITPISRNLIDIAREEVERAQQKVLHTHRTTTFLVAALICLAFIFGVVVARMIHRSVTRRITDLTESASRLRWGNLDISVAEDSADEVGQLGRTFNIMAGRIRELVDDLESKVEQRTCQLAESERLARRIAGELAVGQAFYRNLFDHTGSGVVVFEAVDGGEDFIIKDCNNSFERIEKISREDAVEHRLRELFPGPVTDQALVILREVWQTGSARHFGPLNSISQHRSGWRQGHFYSIPTGQVVAVYDDVTKEHEADLERAAMEARLQRSKKMEAIGLLAGGVAHDLNNILSGITGYPELLMLQLEPGSNLRKPLEAIHSSGLRAAAVVADLLTVARGIASERRLCAMNVLVREYLDSPEFQKLHSLHPGITWTTRLSEDLLQLACSPIHIKKSLMNLVINAAEAIDGVGNIVVGTGNEMIAEERAATLGIKPGRYVVMEVTDSGKGIGDDDIDHIFEPFYTRKVMDRSGTGLGLTVVWNTVQDHGGGIAVESNAFGTSFTLYFPASAGQSEGNKEDDADECRLSAGETVLVVDDEEFQQDIACRMLRQSGYKVFAVSSGEQAVQYLQQNSVDLLVLDMLMEPGMNGRETYERIIRLHPGQKALIVSGFSEDVEVRKARSLGAGGFLQKPYTMKELAKTVRRTLTAEQSAG
ncbi:MAG: hypothetical protein VR65_25880 [Desulfobulbaceae bacterium BRH_c16a]|nr:MAG: hypothetical protein VR65_25880 [Desulfobulbaceae bacterium BRH_c16a]